MTMFKTNYSFSKCPKCEQTGFELVEDTPYKSEYKMWYLRCMSCKTLVTALEYYDINSRLEKLARALRIDLNA